VCHFILFFETLRSSLTQRTEQLTQGSALATYTIARDLLIDCDPGHDDAMALLLAAAAETVDLTAVTTVTDNQMIEKTTRNALRMLTLAERTDIPVAHGVAKPLVREQVTAGWVHGESGLDGATLPEPVVTPSMHTPSKRSSKSQPKAGHSTSLLSARSRISRSRFANTPRLSTTSSRSFLWVEPLPMET
jgi:pyrimidine-specific ribonucleoside hydrolase